MLTVLVADDVSDVLEFVGGTLRKSGYRVFEASGGLDALSILKSQPIDLLVTDVKMPDLSGTELVTRAWRLNPKLPVVFITGYFAADEMPWDMRRRVLVLTKPFLPDALRRAVTQALTEAENPARPWSTRPADQAQGRCTARPVKPPRVA